MAEDRSEDVLPQSNLPAESQEWRRRIEDMLRRALKDSGAMRQEAKSISAYQRATAGSVAAERDARIESVQGALDQASLAKTTADGKNRIIPSQTEPVPEEDGPLTQGDLWFRLDTAGQVVAIEVWNGDDWVPYTLLADQLLVPGSVGTVQIADGAVTAPKVTVDQAFINALFVNELLVQALTGKTITGAIIRTAASGQRMETEENRLRFYGENGATGGFVQGVGNGASGGLLALTATQAADLARGILIGNQNLPQGGSVYARAGSLWVDELYVGQGAERAFADTGWVNLTTGLMNGFSTASQVQFRRIGNVVYLRGQLYRSSAPTNLPAFTLPAEFRPVETTWYNTVAFGAGTQPVFVEVRWDGIVNVLCATARTSGTGYSLVNQGYLAD